jgi:DnaJ-class molecular chaperone
MGDYCERLEGGEGDLILIFRIKEDEKYKITPSNPYDLIYVDEVPVLDCITGCERIFKHIDGKTYKYTLRQGVENGSIINLGNKGLAIGDGRFGNLKIVVKYKMPKSLTEEEKKTINKLKKNKNFS